MAESAGAGTIGAVAILGAGGMGTALALLMDRDGRSVRLWGRDAGRMERMARERVNAEHLPGVPLGASVLATADAGEALRGVDLVVAAVPSAFLRRTLKGVAGVVPAGVPVVSVVKGIEEGTFARPSGVIVDELGTRPVACLSGPSHAEEIARGLPASLVLAGEDDGVNVRVRDALFSSTFRVYTNPDLVGVELAGAMKNVVGIAAGICDGLGFGDNAKAAVLTRGLAEMTRFGVAHGASRETFLGLAGVGDLITTCYSPFGRNRRLGEQLAEGLSLEEIRARSSGVAEGYYTAASALEDAKKRGVDLPITAEVHAILYRGKSPREAVRDLMERTPKEEGA